jgi:hypothetical protein
MRRLFHVSDKFHGIRVLFEPRVPTTNVPMDGEDHTTPRVCFSMSIAGACRATGKIPNRYSPYENKDIIFVYELAEPIILLKPIPIPKKEQDGSYVDGRCLSDVDKTNVVPDCLETGEIWALEPAWLQFVGLWRLCSLKQTPRRRGWIHYADENLNRVRRIKKSDVSILSSEVTA